MKATEQWGSKFNLEEKTKSRRKQFKESLEDLNRESKLHRLVRRLTFTDDVQYGVSTNSISFHAPKNGWASDKMFHKTLAVLVKQFGKFNRKFTDYLGTYYWVTTTEKGLTVRLYDAIKPENCEVVEYIETVKRYKSICGKAKDEATA